MLNCQRVKCIRGNTVFRTKQKKPRVIDRRPLQLKATCAREVVEEEEREAKREAPKHPAAGGGAYERRRQPFATTPGGRPQARSRLREFVRMLGRNAAYGARRLRRPRTGPTMIDPESEREPYRLLMRFTRKQRGHLAPEEDTLLLDLLGKLTRDYLEIIFNVAGRGAKVKARAAPRAATAALTRFA